MSKLQIKTQGLRAWDTNAGLPSVIRLTSWVQSMGSQSDTTARLNWAAQEEKTQRYCSVMLALCDPVDCSPPGSSVLGFSRKEHWSGLPFPSPGDLADPGIKARSPVLQADSLPSEPHLLIIFVDEPYSTRKRERIKEIKQIKQRHVHGQVRSARFRNIKMIESIEQPCTLGQVYS